MTNAGYPGVILYFPGVIPPPGCHPEPKVKENNPDGVQDVNGDGKVDYKDYVIEAKKAAKETYAEFKEKAPGVVAEAKKTGTDLYEDVKEKGAELYEDAKKTVKETFNGSQN